MAKRNDGKSKGKVPRPKVSAKHVPPRVRARPEDSSGWSPPHAAVWVERDPAGRVTMLHHPAHPFQGEWNPGTDVRPLFAIAEDYLDKANKWLVAWHDRNDSKRTAEMRKVVPEAWRRDFTADPQAEEKDRFTLQWLNDGNDPRHTRWTEETSAQSIALLAGLSLHADRGGQSPLYGGQGVRVIAHVGPTGDGKNTVRIVGMTSTLPLWSGELEDAKAAWYPEGGIAFDATALAGLGERIVGAFGLGSPPAEGKSGDRRSRVAAQRVREERAKAAAHGLHVPDAPPRKERKPPGPFYGIATTAPLGSGERISYRLFTRLDPAQQGAELTGGEPLHAEPLIAGIDATALVFKQDPISQNGAAERIRLLPSKSWTVLDPHRRQAQFPGLTAGAKPGTVRLDDPNGNFRVTMSRLVTADFKPYLDAGLPFPEDDPKEVAASVTAHVRSDEFAAANAYHHTSELFRRMARYGLDPAAYFAFAERPMRVRYRAGIYPGALDGRTINAQVWWILKPAVAGGPLPKGILEVRYALGDLESSVELSPLGVAADPRWCWHEFSHVLLMAATAQREFAFAHSAGDALAAIVCDPESKLALDQKGAAFNDGAWRGVTFPWVGESRRHDRDVAEGWSWTGALYQKELFFAPPHLSNKRGYWAEQLLSSSLFRLYRAVGGDTETTDGAGRFVPDTGKRTAASDYVVYLIMQAIRIAGNAWVNTLKTPAQFVAVLESADTASPPAGLVIDYALGTANKVIRWAFERQGLHGLPGPNASVIGPESTMTVDLHVDDLRDQRLGPYTPVNFRDDTWQARTTSVWVRNQADGVALDQTPLSSQPSNFIYVKVQNRGPGPAPAANVAVDAWWADLDASGNAPRFPDAAKWRPLIGAGPDSVPQAGPNAPGEKVFGPIPWPVAGQPPLVKDKRYAILVSATCAADKSNLDATTGYPVATTAGAVELKYVVACDNNLGLRVVRAG